MSFFSKVQDYQDALVDRFCNYNRRLAHNTKWFEEDEDLVVVKKECLKKILFFEERGYYLFQEPEVHHQPLQQRYKVQLIFKPTESNRS
tara:strand:- start:133 stop:399 length:267 start_codon:yes stop_codon:yes gene_type:complete